MVGGKKPFFVSSTTIFPAAYFYYFLIYQILKTVKASKNVVDDHKNSNFLWSMLLSTKRFLCRHLQQLMLPIKRTLPLPVLCAPQIFEQNSTNICTKKICYEIFFSFKTKTENIKDIYNELDRVKWFKQLIVIRYNSVWWANQELVGIHNNTAHEELVEIYNRQTSWKS